MHVTRLRVRLSETDQNGVVYYSQYFVYFDVAKTDFLRHLGLDPIGLGKKGPRLLAAETLCRYHAPARLEDVLDVRAWVSKMGTSSVVFGFEVRRKRTVIAEGYIANVLVAKDGSSVEVPKGARRKLARHLKR